MKPLYDLLKLDTDQKVKQVKKTVVKRKGQCYDSKRKIKWECKLQQVLDEMINYIKSPEVIAYPNFNLPFFITCDACDKGLGAVLYQKQDDVNRVISFASRTLSDAEKNYNWQTGISWS